MDCQAVNELLEGWALGALRPKEEAAVDEHMRTCIDCRHAANELVNATAALPEAVAKASPLTLPPSLKSRVLQSARSSLAGRSHQVPATPSRPRLSELLIRWPMVSQAWWRRLRTLGALTALALLVVSMVWSARSTQALAQERSLRIRLGELVGQQELVFEVVDSRNTLKRVLLPPERTSSAYGKLYSRPDTPYVVAFAARLPQPPPGQVYHLWLHSGSKTVLAGVLQLNTEGFGWLIFKAEAEVPPFEAARLTVEPEGSPSPLGPPVLAWEAPH